MRIGWCAPLARAEVVKRVGYDYLEVPLSPFGLQTDESLQIAKRQVAQSPLPLLVFNWFFPQDMRIVGSAVDPSRVKSYLARAADLMHFAGARSAVLGSAWSRNVSEGADRSRAKEQILEGYRWVADAFRGSGVVVGIEAQNRKEANMITLLSEAVAYAQEVNRPEIKVMADFYHMDEENEPLDLLERYSDWIVHIQLADTGRKNPGTGSYDYGTFFGHLKKCGYDETISVECMIDIPEDEMRRSERFLRSYWPTSGVSPREDPPGSG